MKKYLGYVFIIVIGVASILTLMVRSESLNNNVSKGTNTIELFA